MFSRAHEIVDIGSILYYLQPITIPTANRKFGGGIFKFGKIVRAKKKIEGKRLHIGEGK